MRQHEKWFIGPKDLRMRAHKAYLEAKRLSYVKRIDQKEI